MTGREYPSPTTLLIDAGNSVIKWVSVSQGELASPGRAPHDGVLEKDHALLLSKSVPDAVWVSNVAGADMARSIERQMIAVFDRAPHFARVQPQCCGVRIAYRDPRKLGVDRWLALLAGHALCARPVCIVDAGTALTLDAMDGRGRHLGGAIAPGVDLMTDAVLAGTASVGERDEADKLPLFADDTGAAVSAGAVHAAAALIERGVARLTDRCGVPRLILTGGHAELLGRHLDVDFDHVPDLVLRGLALLTDNKAS